MTVGERIDSGFATAPLLRLWAPLAQRVELLVANRRQGMSAEKEGWWRAAQTPEHGEDYTFWLDGEGPFPDPRSPWQPAR